MGIFDELDKVIDSELSKLEIVNVEETTYKHFLLDDPILDTFIFGNGLPIGSIITFTGHSSAFKSTMCLSIASMLTKNHDNFYLIYLDSESSMTVERIRNIGFEGSNFKIYTGLTIENVNSILNTLSKVKRENKNFENVKFIVVWDSIASTPTQAELTTDDVNKTVGLKARLLSAFIPRWKNSILIKDEITLLIVNQMREKITLLPFQGSGGNLKNLSADKTLPGGLAAQYLSDILIEQKIASKYEEGNSPYGMRAYNVELKTVKNKFFPDNLKITLVFNPQFGYMKEFTQFEFLKATKALNLGGGGYYSFENGGEIFKFRVKELLEKMKEEKFRRAWYNILKEKVKEEEKKIRSQKVEENE